MFLGATLFTIHQAIAAYLGVEVNIKEIRLDDIIWKVTTYALIQNYYINAYSIVDSIRQLVF